ncbi:MAG: peptide chain release factor-like protein [Candidatus Omnitrophota bacterium]
MSDLREQTKVTFYKSSGPGGQRKNKKQTAVRLYHMPTGVTAVATEHRYQSDNIDLAFRRLEEKIRQLTKKRKPRITSKPRLIVEEHRIRFKKLKSQKKVLRRKVNPVRMDWDF